MTDIFYKNLISWIKSGNIHKFYISSEWRRLRAEVLKEQHYECQMCKAKHPDNIVFATTVHHINHVRTHPRLALSKYSDEEKKKLNLMAVCDECHYLIHHPLDAAEKEYPERW